MDQHILLDNYSPAADIVVTSICLIMIILVHFSYFSRTRSSKLFLSMIVILLLAAWADIIFFTIAVNPDMQTVANWFRCFYHALLFLILVYFIAYICEVTRYDKPKPFVLTANILFLVVLVADIITTAIGPTFTLVGNSIVFAKRGIFMFGFISLMGLGFIVLTKSRKRLFRRVIFGFYGTLVISFVILFIQGLNGQNSFTVSALLFPVIAMMYVLHSNPYDARLGTNDLKSMNDLARYYSGKKKDFIFMSLFMHSFEEEVRDIPDDMKAIIREVSYNFFKGWRLFRIGKGHVVMIFLKSRNPDYERKIQGMLEVFHKHYLHYRYDYKIVIGESDDEISRNGLYADFIDAIQRTMPECSIHRESDADLAAFHKSQYILSELADIYQKADPNDARVLCYCQPVLNVKTGKHESAEILTRLDLEKTGIICPEHFIPLAEQQGYIHTLTMIILQKTCVELRHLEETGHEINRVSINVSAGELREDDFCRDIIDIIEGCGVSGDKIAIEITESISENDFILMKEKILELRKKGILFYLDDFGTGYSNMDRIMELPFDMIKFDRTMVQASRTDKRSRQMVSYLANMFYAMNYSVLYEGVETESDEIMCKLMSATHLQGFRYSKAIPIEELVSFL